MAKVSLVHLRKQFDSSVAVDDFSLEIEDGELVTFLGPSGCGKTTTLRMIAGFVAPTHGKILIDGEDVTQTRPHKRNTGMVFQRYALFPHMTVAENIAFGLEMHKVPPAARQQRVATVLDMVRMTGFKDRYPRQLSGGQQQRVAIARALAIQPQVFLLDEPLSNLDAKLRQAVREEIRELQQSLGLTTVFVTHDQEEALAMSDRMVIMHKGTVQQVGKPSDVYERPVNLLVADFLGKMNFFRGRPIADHAFLTATGTVLSVAALRADTQCVGVRPERMLLSSQPQLDNSIQVKVTSVAYLGPQIEVTLMDAGNELIRCQLSNAAGIDTQVFQSGAEVFVNWRADDNAVFCDS
jgi:putative spermidine/putrescine transport system ATP-binding protein